MGARPDKATSASRCAVALEFDSMLPGVIRLKGNAIVCACEYYSPTLGEAIPLHSSRLLEIVQLERSIIT